MEHSGRGVGVILLIMKILVLISVHYVESTTKKNPHDDVNLDWNRTKSSLANKQKEIVESKNDQEEFDQDFPIFVFMCIVYTISTLSAIFTNLIVLIVYIFGQRSKTELSIFLINLAIADFLMSTFCMPFTFAQALLKRWIFGEIMCPIGKIQLFK
jgi:hypothetical protein